METVDFKKTEISEIKSVPAVPIGGFRQNLLNI